MVFADVGGDGGREKLAGTGALFEFGADAAGRNQLVEIGEKVEARFAVARAAQAQDEVIGLRGVAGGDRDDGGQRGGDAAEVEAGASGDGEVTGEQEIRGAVPLADAQEGISAEKAEEVVGGGEAGSQGADGVDSVVGAVIGAGRIDEGDFKARLAVDGETGHGDAILVAGLGTIALKGLEANRREQNAVEGEAIHRQPGEGDVATVGRIKAAAEKPNVHNFRG